MTTFIADKTYRVREGVPLRAPGEGRAAFQAGDLVKVHNGTVDVDQEILVYPPTMPRTNTSYLLASALEDPDALPQVATADLQAALVALGIEGVDVAKVFKVAVAISEARA